MAFDYELEKDRLLRRRKIAEALLASSQTPMGGTETVGGIAIRRSPLEGIAKVAQAYFGTKRQNEVDDEMRALGERQRGDVAAALRDYSTAIAPKTQITGSTPMDDPTAEGGQFVTETTPVSPQDKQAAAFKLMGAAGGDPRDVAKAVVASAMKGPESFGKIEPKDYTPASIAKFSQSGNYADLVPVRKLDFVSAGGKTVAADPYAATPGQAIEHTPAPAAPTEVSRLIAERDALPPNDPRRATLDDAIKKATTHQPAASANVTVNTEKQFLGQIGESLGKDVATAAQNARGAVGTINTVNQIREALDSGSVVAGPGATPQVVLMQIAQRLSPGAEPSQAQVKTRQVIQSLAQLELDAAAQMKGQGQITEGERDIIRRAASGNIDSLTVPELRVLTDTLDKTARYKIGINAANVNRLRANPSAAAMVDFMKVDEPPAYARKDGVQGQLTPAERQELEALKKRYPGVR